MPSPWRVCPSHVWERRLPVCVCAWLLFPHHTRGGFAGNSFTAPKMGLFTFPFRRSGTSPFVGIPNLGTKTTEFYVVICVLLNAETLAVVKNMLRLFGVLPTSIPPFQRTTKYDSQTKLFICKASSS